ncbi:MAG: minor capsid protein [Eubacteriales bacterium]|nr:minor capsid protein [Eubacteriales bacterium]
MNSAEYWKKRALEAKRLTAQEAEKTAAYVEHQYRLAMKDIDDRINLWYKRFAQDNGMTMIEAKKALNSQELKSFRMDVKRYIREGKAMNGRMDPSWMKRLRNAAAVHHIERFEAIKIQTQQAMEVLYGNQLDAIDELTKKTYENGYYHSLYSIQTKTGLGWTVNAIDKKKLATIISKPWAPDGESFSSRIWKNRAVAVNELHAALTQSCITGAPAERVAQQMAARLRVRASDAARLIRTESAHFAATGDRQAYKDTGVEQYQWIAGLDHTTCTLCQELDAHVFDLNEAEEGMTLPPRHPNCRCTTVPYFDDEFTVDETRAARDENGKTKQIPADMTYDAWEREFAPVEAEIRTQKRAAYARRDYNYRSNSGKIDIEIDTFVPCLKDAETGEILDTVVKRIISPNELKGLNKKAGWYINWQKELKGGHTISALYLKGSDVIQGITSTDVVKENLAVHGRWIVANPQNRGPNKKYKGVGGHLFAIAGQQSVDAGFGGFMYAEAANKQLLDYYKEVFGAEEFPSAHPYSFSVNEQSMTKLLETYNFEMER